MTKTTHVSTGKSFILHKDFHDQLQELSVEQAGHLIKAVFSFHANEEYLVEDPVVKFALKGLLNQFKRDAIKYSQTCAKRSDAGKKGAKQKLANAGKRKHKVANQADSDSDNKSDSESDSENNSSADGLDSKLNEIAEHYNNVRGAMPECKKLTSARKSQIRARIDDVGFDELKRVISSCADMPLLQGKNDRGWTADIEWITKESNFTKIIEGRYTDKKKTVRLGI